MTSNNVVSDVPMRSHRQKHAFKGFKFSLKKNGPDFKIGQTDLDDLKNIIMDVPKCLLRQKHAFKGFKFSFEKKTALTSK